MDEKYLPPVMPTVHYGHWHMPSGFRQIAKLHTIPRTGETEAQVATDEERRSWPSR